MFARPIAGFAALALFASLSSQTLAQDATLSIGDPAPRLEVSKWVKGEPVKEFEKGKIYVVEFWATWCGPCRQTIPHLTELQAQYKDVVFIGQDVFEEDESAVGPFVTTMGDRMNYRVALDDKSRIDEGAMATRWMKASGSNGIPTAFIVDKESRIAWLGHPMQLEPRLKAVVAGTHDIAKAKAAAVIQKRLMSSLQTGNLDEAMKITDELSAADPTEAEAMEMLRFRLLSAKHDYAAAQKKAAELGEKNKDNPDTLNEIAWRLVSDPQNPNPDLDLALKLVTRANEKTEGKQPGVLDTLAVVHARRGDLAKAIEVQARAVQLAVDPQEKAQLSARLEEFKKKNGAK